MQPKSRILIVDDHWRNVAILLKLLGRDFAVATAANGEEALAVAPRFEPDLALLDIMMPGMDGYEVCRRFRSTPGLAATKILMVSAKGLPAERLAGYEAGADDYVVKPFDPDELLAKIRVYLKLKSVEEVDRLKTDVLMLFNHETRTPITTVLSPLELLLEDPALTAAQRNLVTMAQDSARRVHDMVERIAFLGRLHADHVDFVMTPLDLSALVAEVSGLVREQGAAGGVELAEALEEGVTVTADAGLMRRALEVLADNAVRHGGGHVEIRLATLDGQAVLSVADHGPGLPEGFLEHAFDLFVVGDIDRHSRGHGLGLATARAIVRCHDGQLTAENAADGGAVFTLRLPLPGWDGAAEPARPAAGAVRTD